MTHLLLLNASNYPQRPIYPYAFVQVRALARKHGLSVHCHDLLFTPKERWGADIAALISQHRPEMVGVHLRQADSLIRSEYDAETTEAYFPVHDTVSVLQHVREHTTVPTVGGGFGFTTHARDLFDRFELDYGVRGAPDSFLKHFGDVRDGRRLSDIDNLSYRDGSRVAENQRDFPSPLDDREYDDVVVAALRRFYAAAPTPPGGDESIAIEVARGCPYRCYFCTEPAVKGRRVRPRNLEAVDADVEYLVRRGFRRFWMVCSELNPGKTDHALSLAERMVRLQERLHVPFAWHAYHLPRWLGSEELTLLARSGFVGGWNDFPSFEDANLRATRVPYQSRHAIDHIRTSLNVLPSSPYAGPPHFSIFLGNAFATPQTIAVTLREYHDAELHHHFESVGVTTATRLFRTGGAAAPGADDAETFLPSGRAPVVDPVDPTFHFAPELVAAAGGKQELLSILEYVRGSLLSPSGPTPDWCELLETAAPRAQIAAWLSQWQQRPWKMRGLPAHLQEKAARLVEEIVRCDDDTELNAFLRAALDDELRGAVALSLVRLVLALPAPRYAELLDYLDLAPEQRRSPIPTTYSLLCPLLARFDGVGDLLDAVERDLGIARSTVEVFRLICLLRTKNVHLDPKLRSFVLVAETAARAATGGAS